MLNFLPTTWRKKDLAVQNGQIEQMKKHFPPLPSLTADRVTVSHSLNFIHITNVIVIVRHYFWIYYVAFSMRKSPSCGRSWMLVSMQTSVWSIQLLTNCPWSLLIFPYDNSTTFNFFIKWPKSSVEEKKSSIYGHVLQSSSSGSITLAWVAVKCYALHQVDCVICVTTWVVKFVNFDVKMLVFLGNILSEKSPFLLNNTNIVNLPDFRKGCKILKMSCLEFQIHPIFSIICHNYLPSCQLHSCCPCNPETKVCVNYLFCLIMLLWSGV